MSLSMTAIARWTSFFSLVMRHVSRLSPRWCCCCFMTAAALPGRRVGSGTPDSCMHERVFEEGGATRAAAVATCAQVLMRVFGLGGVMALRSHDACRLCWCFRLDDSAANVVGLLLDSVMIASRGTLIGLTGGMSVGTLGTGSCGTEQLKKLGNVLFLPRPF